MIHIDHSFVILNLYFKTMSWIAKSTLTSNKQANAKTLSTNLISTKTITENEPTTFDITEPSKVTVDSTGNHFEDNFVGYEILVKTYN